MISPLWSASLCGGDFLEDVGETGKTLRLAPGARVPSADTVGRAIKELATDSIEYTSKAGNTYAFNPCEKQNGLLLDVTMQLGLLKRGQVVVGERYVYRCILTDDWEHTEKEIELLHLSHSQACRTVLRPQAHQPGKEEGNTTISPWG